MVHKIEGNKSRNLNLRCGDKYNLWSKMIKEVELFRFARPFVTIHYQDSYVQSPVGLVNKANGQMRLNFHLSFDFAEHKSINFHT